MDINIQINKYNIKVINERYVESIGKSQENPQEKESNFQKKNFSYTKQGKSQKLASPDSQGKNLGTIIDILA
jgi:hypothetical protein